MGSTLDRNFRYIQVFSDNGELDNQIELESGGNPVFLVKVDSDKFIVKEQGNRVSKIMIREDIELRSTDLSKYEGYNITNNSIDQNYIISGMYEGKYYSTNELIHSEISKISIYSPSNNSISIITYNWTRILGNGSMFDLPLHYQTSSVTRDSIVEQTRIDGIYITRSHLTREGWYAISASVDLIFHGTTNGENFTLFSEQQVIVKFHVDNYNDYDVLTAVYKGQLSDKSRQITLSHDGRYAAYFPSRKAFLVIMDFVRNKSYLRVFPEWHQNNHVRNKLSDFNFVGDTLWIQLYNQQSDEFYHRFFKFNPQLNSTAYYDYRLNRGAELFGNPFSVMNNQIIWISDEKINSSILINTIKFFILVPVIIVIYYIIKRTKQINVSDYFRENYSSEDSE